VEILKPAWTRLDRSILIPEIDKTNKLSRMATKNFGKLKTSLMNKHKRTLTYGFVFCAPNPNSWFGINLRGFRFTSAAEKGLQSQGSG
jgi:hypothetical protein